MHHRLPLCPCGLPPTWFCGCPRSEDLRLPPRPVIFGVRASIASAAAALPDSQSPAFPAPDGAAIVSQSQSQTCQGIEGGGEKQREGEGKPAASSGGASLPKHSASESTSACKQGTSTAIPSGVSPSGPSDSPLPVDNPPARGGTPAAPSPSSAVLCRKPSAAGGDVDPRAGVPTGAAGSPSLRPEPALSCPGSLLVAETPPTAAPAWERGAALADMVVAGTLDTQESLPGHAPTQPSEGNPRLGLQYVWTQTQSQDGPAVLQAPGSTPGSWGPQALTLVEETPPLPRLERPGAVRAEVADLPVNETPERSLSQSPGARPGALSEPEAGRSPAEVCPGAAPLLHVHVDVPLL